MLNWQQRLVEVEEGRENFRAASRKAKVWSGREGSNLHQVPISFPTCPTLSLSLLGLMPAI